MVEVRFCLRVRLSNFENAKPMLREICHSVVGNWARSSSHAYAQPRLADFIREQIEPILQAWEDFARTIEPPALTMTDLELRGHAHRVLLTLADGLDGTGAAPQDGTVAELHAEARLQSGYTVVQLVSEYRALRASVMSLWVKSARKPLATDLSDMIRFNQAIDQALAESVARYHRLVNQSQNMFLAILGHDLRNPIGTLVAGTSLMLQDLELAPKYALLASRMFGSAKRMTRMINDLIEFSRTHLGKGIPVETAQGDFVSVCQQVVNELRTYHPNRFVELRTPAHIEAKFDGDRIAQMLSNLIGNALQYGSEIFPILVTASCTDEIILVTINNRGRPIPVDKLSCIFDPMVRLGTHDKVDSIARTSLGMGLYIAREIAHAHGGHISVTSCPDNGTTFRVSLPRTIT